MMEVVFHVESRLTGAFDVDLPAGRATIPAAAVPQDPTRPVFGPPPSPGFEELPAPAAVYPSSIAAASQQARSAATSPPAASILRRSDGGPLALMPAERVASCEVVVEL
jgi:hypothetical protein